MANSIRPRKPYPAFPLTPHASGAWQKKIRGRIHYFGRWGKRVNGRLVRIEGDGWKEALELYKAQADDLHAGRTPRVNKSDGLTIADLCNRFLTAKLRKVESGELGSRMFQDYREATDLLVNAFGKDRQVDDLAAADFEKLRAKMTERWGPVRLGNAITRVKSIFKYGTDNDLIEKAVRYGSEFRKPDKAVLRRHRATNGTKMFEAEALRRLIDAASVQLRAMILLGLNCGYGNHDVATLPLSAINLGSGWIDFPRPKTGIPRRCPLWAETIAAIREVLKEKPAPFSQDDQEIVFLQKSGRRWVRNTDKARTDNVSSVFNQLQKKCGMHRPGIGFYSLRHVFRTVADGARDPVAIDLIMGHSDPSMGGHYRERIEDSRLRAVVEHVRHWLFGDTPDGSSTGPDSMVPDSCDPSDPAPLPTKTWEKAQPNAGRKPGSQSPAV
jgi:integrase